MRLAVLPLDIKQRRSMRATQRLQPQLDAIKAKYKNDQATMQKKTQEIYKASGVNPLAGCLPSIVQLFIFVAFFGAQRAIAYEQIENMFHLAEAGKPLAFESFLWVQNLWQADTFNIGIPAINYSLIPTWKQLLAYENMVDGFSLTESVYTNVMAPYIEHYKNDNNGLFILPVLATALSFLQGKLTMGNQPKKDQPKKDAPEAMPNMGKMMQYMMPIMSLFICTTTSAAYALYWTTTSLIAVISYLIMNKAFKAEDDMAEQIVIEEKPSRKMERKLPKI